MRSRRPQQFSDGSQENDRALDRAETLRAADQVVALAGIGTASNDNSVAPLTRRPAAGDLSPSGGEVQIPSPSGGSGGGLN
jgi:hypothetical protein